MQTQKLFPDHQWWTESMKNISHIAIKCKEIDNYIGKYNKYWRMSGEMTNDVLTEEV